MPRQAFEEGTGWALKPEGACKGDICIPLSDMPGEEVDIRLLADEMGLPLVEDEVHGLYALGPESISSRAMMSAETPELELPDRNGTMFRLSSLRGQKVVLVAWAPY